MMEKVIFNENERAAIVYDDTRANANHNTPRSRTMIRHWQQGPDNEVLSSDARHWRFRSMITAFKTARPLPEPGTPWHEVQAGQVALQCIAKGYEAAKQNDSYINERV